MAEYGAATDLKHCLKSAGLSADAAEDRVRELRDLGFSGEIPQRYWLNLDDRALIDGATFDETARFHRRIRRAEPVGNLLARRQRRMRRATITLRKALAELAPPQLLNTAPVVGDLITADGEVIAPGIRGRTTAGQG